MQMRKKKKISIKYVNQKECTELLRRFWSSLALALWSTGENQQMEELSAYPTLFQIKSVFKKKKKKKEKKKKKKSKG